MADFVSEDEDFSMRVKKDEDGVERMYNWGETYSVTTDKVSFPESIEDVQNAVKTARKVRAAGAMHSCSPLIDSDERIISMQKLDKITNIDKETKRVKIQAGVTIAKLCKALALEGLGLANLGSTDYQTMIGAMMTGTHGGSIFHGSLHTFATSYTIVTPNGNLMVVTKESDPEVFSCIAPSIGVCGIVVEAEVQCVDLYWLRAEMEVITQEEMPSMYRKFSQDHEYTRIIAYPSINAVTLWKVDKVDKGSTDSTDQVHNTYVNFRSLEEQKMIYQFLHLNRKRETQPEADDILRQLLDKQLQRMQPYRGQYNHVLCLEKYLGIHCADCEIGFDFEDCEKVLTAIVEFYKKWRGPYYIYEIRTTPKDSALLSCANGRDCLWFEFQCPNDKSDDYFGILFQHFDQYGFRKHWAKGVQRNLDPQLVLKQFSGLPKFGQIMTKLDPNLKFQNVYTEKFFRDMGVINDNASNKSISKDTKHLEDQNVYLFEDLEASGVLFRMD